MIGTIKTGTIPGATISAVISKGLGVTTTDGQAAQLAIIDPAGNIIAAGASVEREAFNVSIASYKNFLKGQGHLRVSSGELTAVAA